VIVAFVLTAFAPGVLFVLGPALLGVPHVASDIRYLVLRQDLPRAWIAVIVASSGFLIALRALEALAPHALPFAHAELATGWAWALGGVLFGAWNTRSTASLRRASQIAPVILLLAVLALSHPAAARGLFAYVHNLVAPVIWLLLFRRRKMGALVPLAVIAFGLAAITAGLTLPLLHADNPWTSRLLAESENATRGAAPATSMIVGLSYTFLQAVHYSIWLTWIPAEEIRGDRTLTFRMSARSARRDFGPLGMALIAVMALLVVGASFVAIHRTRALYLSLATFHGYLELACLAFAWTRGTAFPIGGRPLPLRTP
jgi:hypothetical protein